MRCLCTFCHFTAQCIMVGFLILYRYRTPMSNPFKQVFYLHVLVFIFGLYITWCWFFVSLFIWCLIALLKLNTHKVLSWLSVKHAHASTIDSSANVRHDHSYMLIFYLMDKGYRYIVKWQSDLLNTKENQLPVCDKPSQGQKSTTERGGNKNFGELCIEVSKTCLKWCSVWQKARKHNAITHNVKFHILFA